MGGDFADEAARGSGCGGRSFGTAEGDVASANKAARTSVGHVVAVRQGGRGSTTRRCGCGHEMTEGIFASKEKSA